MLKSKKKEDHGRTNGYLISALDGCVDKNNLKSFPITWSNKSPSSCLTITGGIGWLAGSSLAVFTMAGNYAQPSASTTVLSSDR